VFGISGNRAQRLCRRAKEQRIDHTLIVIGNGGKLMGQGKHDVEIRDG
jgi:hypothetical protein